MQKKNNQAEQYLGEFYNKDLEDSLKNIEQLRGNLNLMKWYRELFSKLICPINNAQNLKILEIGSGISPLKVQFPFIETSDVMNLPGIDFVFDCHEIDLYQPINDREIDYIVMTNVLHHLRAPLEFLNGASKKLKKGGRIIMVEPFASFFTYPLYKIFHHEPMDFSVQSPALPSVIGPLSSSNQAIPQLLFFKRKEWLIQLECSYNLEGMNIEYYPGISYMLTGGISSKFKIPIAIYDRLYALDKWLVGRFPKVFAGFFIVTLEAL